MRELNSLNEFQYLTISKNSNQKYLKLKKYPKLNFFYQQLIER